jgi:hypothetical protein
MQHGVVILVRIQKLKKFGEAGLVNHARKQGLFVVAIEEEEAGYGMERASVVLLQQAVDDLLSNVVFIISEQGTP